MKAKGKRTCPVCGTLFPDSSASCPVCALKGALKSESGASSIEDGSSGLRFEHYRVLQNEDGTPIELGHGAMGVTYKAFDVHLQCPVALKIINARFVGDDSARHRFVREARAAASVRHPNVASVFHLGETDGNYFYAMEFVDGETLEKLIRRSGTLPKIHCRDARQRDRRSLAFCQPRYPGKLLRVQSLAQRSFDFAASNSLYESL